MCLSTTPITWSESIRLPLLYVSQQHNSLRGSIQNVDEFDSICASTLQQSPVISLITFQSPVQICWCQTRLNSIWNEKRYITFISYVILLKYVLSLCQKCYISNCVTSLLRVRNVLSSPTLLYLNFLSIVLVLHSNQIIVRNKKRILKCNVEIANFGIVNSKGLIDEISAEISKTLTSNIRITIPVLIITVRGFLVWKDRCGECPF